MDPNKEVLLDVSSTSDSDTDYITPLTDLRKEELEQKERELKLRAKQSKKAKKLKKKTSSKKKKKNGRYSFSFYKIFLLFIVIDHGLHARVFLHLPLIRYSIESILIIFNGFSF